MLRVLLSFWNFSFLFLFLQKRDVLPRKFGYWLPCEAVSEETVFELPGDARHAPSERWCQAGSARDGFIARAHGLLCVLQGSSQPVLHFSLSTEANLYWGIGEGFCRRKKRRKKKEHVRGNSRPEGAVTLDRLFKNPKEKILSVLK